MKKKEPR